MTTIETLTLLGSAVSALIAAFAAFATVRQAKASQAQAKATLEQANAAYAQAEETRVAADIANKAAQLSMAQQMLFFRSERHCQFFMRAATGVSGLYAAAMLRSPLSDEQVLAAANAAEIYSLLEFHREEINGPKWSKDAADLRSKVWTTADNICKQLLDRTPVAPELATLLLSDFRRLQDQHMFNDASS